VVEAEVGGYGEDGGEVGLGFDGLFVERGGVEEVQVLGGEGVAGWGGGEGGVKGGGV
jgi:hypothetical protein